MHVSDPLDQCEDCRRLAAATADVDRQSLLLFMADAWQTIAETGEASAAAPGFLRQRSDRRHIFH